MTSVSTAAAVTAHGHNHEEGSRDGSAIDLLEKAGKTAELAKLSQCIAKANGHVSFELISNNISSSSDANLVCIRRTRLTVYI